MFEFKWQSPAQPSEQITLQIHSHSSWFARKVLRIGDEVVFRRGRLQGVEARFKCRGTEQQLHLRLEQEPNTPSWRPALFCGDAELPEQTNTEPPQLARRPRVLSVVVGLTYLVILLGVVTLPPIVNILVAVHRDSGESYSAAQDVVPWVLPFVVTAVCLVGFWNMRKWSVHLYTPAVALQGLLWNTGAVPIATTALILQIVICFMGVAYLSKMQ